MMKQNPFISLLFALIFLVACAGNEEAAVSSNDVIENSATTNTIDIANLPDTVDVQTVAAIKELETVFVLDVREQWEYDEGHIPGVTLIPVGEVADRLNEIPTDQEIIVTCRSGNRSGQITAYLQAQGYTNVHNMQGGIIAWESAGFAVEQ